MLTRPDDFDVIATTNLNGDYLSDALAAQVGGIGIAPGGNINYVTGHGVFEATHGTAPKYAGQDKVNPSSVLLSGVMMFEHLGWTKAAADIERALEATIADKVVTYDFARLMEGATEVKTSAVRPSHRRPPVATGALRVQLRASRRRGGGGLAEVGEELVCACRRSDVEDGVGGPGRGAGRFELGGRDRFDASPGRRPRPRPPRRELVPADRALIRHVPDAGRRSTTRRAQHRREVGDDRRVAALVVDEAHRRVASRTSRRTVLRHVARRTARTPTTCARPRARRVERVLAARASSARTR